MTLALIFQPNETENVRRPKLNSLISELNAATAITTNPNIAALAAYNTNGIVTQTAPATFTGRTITGTANEITVTNGSGVAGNPTLSLPSALTFTGKTITGGIYSSMASIDVAGAAVIAGAITATGSALGSTIIFRGTSGGAGATTGLRLYDIDDSHTMRITCGSDLTANRTLTITAGNANRTFDISAGDVTISTAGAALIDDADAAAQRATLGLIAAGAGDIWVEKAGDTMTGPLILETAATDPQYEARDTSAPGAGAGGRIRLRVTQKPTASGHRLGVLHFAAPDSGATVQNSASIEAFATENWGTLGGEGTELQFGATANGAFSRTMVAAVTPTGVEPVTDNAYYLGRNDDDSPRAWKGIILKDQTTGVYYRLQINSGAVNLIDLTD